MVNLTSYLLKNATQCCKANQTTKIKVTVKIKPCISTAVVWGLYYFLSWQKEKGREMRVAFLTLLWESFVMQQFLNTMKVLCEGLVQGSRVHSLAVDPACVSIPWSTNWKTWGPLHSRPIRTPSEIIYLTFSSINQLSRLVTCERKANFVQGEAFVHSFPFLANAWLVA